MTRRGSPAGLLALLLLLCGIGAAAAASPAPTIFMEYSNCGMWVGCPFFYPVGGSELGLMCCITYGLCPPSVDMCTALPNADQCSGYSCRGANAVRYRGALVVEEDGDGYHFLFDPDQCQCCIPTSRGSFGSELQNALGMTNCSMDEMYYHRESDANCTTDYEPCEDSMETLEWQASTKSCSCCSQRIGKELVCKEAKLNLAGYFYFPNCSTWIGCRWPLMVYGQLRCCSSRGCLVPRDFCELQDMEPCTGRSCASPTAQLYRGVHGRTPTADGGYSIYETEGCQCCEPEEVEYLDGIGYTSNFTSCSDTIPPYSMSLLA